MASSYRQREDLLARNIAGETIVVPIRGKLADLQKIFALNETADHLWKQLSTSRSLDDLCRSLVEEFHVEPQQAHKDVQEFLDQLIAAGLIEPV